MGGNALKLHGFEAKRISAEEFQPLVDEILNLTASNFEWLRPTRFWRTKPNHGDIDFIANLTQDMVKKRDQSPEEKANGITPPPLWVTEAKKAFQSQAVHWNAPVASFEFRGVQIDIAGQVGDIAATDYLNFCHYSPLGNIVGRMLKQTGVKWGVDGLTYPIRETIDGKGDLLGSIVLSHKMEDVLELAGLDPAKWHEGFDTENEIYDYACGSRLFNKAIFQFENLNHVNRKRDRVRKDYNAWMKYILDKPDVYRRYENEEERKTAKEGWMKELVERFPFLPTEIQKVHDAAAQRKNLRTNKFNGDLVKEWTGLSGPDLGKAIKAFRNTFKSSEEFDTWLENTPAEQVREKFLEKPYGFSMEI